MPASSSPASRRSLLVLVFGVGITAATVLFPYTQIANILKWLALSLFAYVIAAFVSGGSWAGVLHDTFVPSWPHGSDAWGMLVAILGTTISPYLFYWQASEETEEEKAHGLKTVASRRGATAAEIIDRKLDVGLGTFFSNLVMYFIILTTALTLHRHGITRIDTSQTGRPSPRPHRRPFRRSSLHRRPHRRRLPRHPHHVRLRRLRPGGDLPLARGPR